MKRAASLYSKFVMYTIGIMVVSGLVAFLIVNTLYHQYMKEENDAKNIAIATEIAAFITENEDVSIEAYLTAQAASGYKLILVDEEQRVTFFGEAFREHNLSKDAMELVLSGNHYHGMNELPKETFVTGFFSDESANTVGVPFLQNDTHYALFIRPDIKALFSEVHYMLGILLGGMALISVLAMLFVARMLIQPLSILMKATKKIGDENYAVTLPTNRQDEIGQLALSFEQMAMKLKQADQMRKQFINDVSHDFQTPLQTIKGYTALLTDESLASETLHRYTMIVQQETERLSALTNQLLLLTTLDSLPAPVRLDTFSLHEQLTRVLQRYRWLMNEKDISLTTEINDVTIRANEELLEKLWENMLSNALKYTSQGGSIHLQLIETENDVIVQFSDTGIGIDSTDIPHLFDRFFRADKARNSEVGGTGLGLAIVQQIVDYHKGTIEVTSKVNEGTTFSLRLPTHP